MLYALSRVRVGRPTPLSFIESKCVAKSKMAKLTAYNPIQARIIPLYTIYCVAWQI